MNLCHISLTIPFFFPPSQDASMQDLRLPHAASSSLELYLPRGVAGAVDLLALLNRAVHKVLRDGEDN